MSTFKRCIVVLTFFLSFSVFSFDASYAINLSRPVDADIKKTAQQGAEENLRKKLYQWLRTEFGDVWDTTGVIGRYHLYSFFENSLAYTSSTSTFQGKTWIYTLSLDDVGLVNTIEKWNATNDSLAILYFNRLTSGAGTNFETIYRNAARTILTATSHIGLTQTIHGIEKDSLLNEAFRILDSCLSKVSITSNAFVLKGTPGFPPANSFHLIAKFDTLPLPHFTLSAFMQSGEKIFTRKTTEKGIISLDSFPIPYVAPGSLLYFRPVLFYRDNKSRPYYLDNFGHLLQVKPEHTVMLNTKRPTFYLSYSANTTNTLKMPEEYANGKFLETFLRDSCFMDPAGLKEEADVLFDITCQFSQYTHDATEKNIVTTTSRIHIKEIKNALKREVIKHLEQKRDYKVGVDIPSGLFFWEFGRELQTNVKATLLTFQ